ncbi:MAG: SDR family oxidoreductase, partial [Steroidobacteraceae bacterium]
AGLFTEEMFAEAEGLDHPSFRTKHDAEAIVRRESSIPWRIYRPALVVGDSRSGEMDKIDGPYYFFKLIQRLRGMLPSWVPMVGIEGGRINIVPVDFVVNAVDHIAHRKGEDVKCFHLVDPSTQRVGELLNTFARAAHAPEMSLRVNAALFNFTPGYLRQGVLTLKPVRRIWAALMKDLGLPEDILRFINYPTRFDCRETTRALKGTGIAVPPLDTYAWRLWDYWERHLDPDLFMDSTLRGQVAGKLVLVTGASSGIGKATAFKLAEAGAQVLTIAHDPEQLAEAVREFAAAGYRLHAYVGDLADMASAEAVLDRLLAEHGRVDILVNNAGRSIRRAIENSFERFHDFERTMQLNYFACVRLTLNLMPSMTARKDGHVINVSSIGVLTNAPRFSAYVASKAAMESFSRCAASVFHVEGVHFTIINMPLVRTPMIAPTRIYEDMPTIIEPEEAADMIADAIIRKPQRLATRLGVMAEIMHLVMPKLSEVVMNSAFRMFPDSAAAQGKRDGEEQRPATREAMFFASLMRGIHW